MRLNHPVDLTFGQQFVGFDGGIDLHHLDARPLALQPVGGLRIVDDRHGMDAGQAIAFRLHPGNQHKRVDREGPGECQAVLAALTVGQGSDQAGRVALGAPGHGLHRGHLARVEHQPGAVVDQLQYVGGHAAKLVLAIKKAEG
ncbi:hypothetical protein D3C76_1271740 [compost metagenome]